MAKSIASARFRARGENARSDLYTANRDVTALKRTTNLPKRFPTNPKPGPAPPRYLDATNHTLGLGIRVGFRALPLLGRMRASPMAPRRLPLRRRMRKSWARPPNPHGASGN